mgnify:FL=1|tara:strand:- start:29285 stop:30436 length:1152 start_codon:yes stop_codon:yes gene_type:complete
MFSYPSSLYVHLPWCHSKYPYCDFNSIVLADESDLSKYTKLIIKDIENEASKFEKSKLRTIFIGGGTPNLVDPLSISEILNSINTNFDIESNCEITMEINPRSINEAELMQYRAAGVNRLSVGAQSFNQKLLKSIGRDHDPEDIVSVFKAAGKVEFKSINIDMMFGLPDQTRVTAKDDIREVIDLSPEHISYYQLTDEQNTNNFCDKSGGLPSDDEQNYIQEDCVSLLESAGYTRYEITSFSKKNFECKHNLNYCRFGDYIAVGAGAHGKFRLTKKNMIRYQKSSDPHIYMKNIISNKSCYTEKLLSNSDKIFEFMLNNLRLMSGFSIVHFESATGLKYDAIERKLSELNNLNLMEYYPTGYWKPTALGFKFLDNLQCEFLKF